MVIKAWIAMNRGEFNPENMDFYKTKREMDRCWDDGQQVKIPCKIVIEQKYVDCQKESNEQ